MRILSLKTVTSIGLVSGLLIMFGCGGSSSSVPAAAPTSINLNGGNANPGTPFSTGGAGGFTSIVSDGTLNLSTSGTVDVSFTVPPVTPDYGSTPYTVSIDETVQLDPSADIAGLYTLTGDTALYLSDGNLLTTDPVVTGLLVQQGTTLTLPDNTLFGSSVILDNDIVIDGTIKTELESMAITLESSSGNLIIGSTGVITTRPATPGGNGGDINLIAGVQIINQGLIDASGADGENSMVGGSAAFVVLDSRGAIYNTGTVRADGGNNTNGNGGDAEAVEFYALESGLYSSGKITANGGSAVNGYGGWGGSIYIGTDDITKPQEMLIGGLLATNGGDAQNGNGGDVFGTIVIENSAAPSSRLLINVRLSAQGGSSTGAVFSGGSGYNVYVHSNLGSLSMTGSIDVSGGNSDSLGGESGWLDVYSSDNMELVGYDGILLNGGSGESGGAGGELFAESVKTTNNLNISANGGDGAINSGGAGGTIWINSTTPPTVTTDTLSVSAGLNSTVDGTITLDVSAAPI